MKRRPAGKQGAKILALLAICIVVLSAAVFPVFAVGDEIGAPSSIVQQEREDLNSKEIQHSTSLPEQTSEPEQTTGLPVADMDEAAVQTQKAPAQPQRAVLSGVGGNLNENYGEKYYVVLDYNYDGSPDRVKLQMDAGTRIGHLSERPQREGYTFIDWYILDDGPDNKKLFDPDTIMPEEDVFLYAGWEINKYLVIYEANGGMLTGDAYEIVNHGDIPSKQDDPICAGHSFLGWSRDMNHFDEYDLTKPITEDIILYAAWALKSHDVRFEVEGNGRLEGVVSYNVLHGTSWIDACIDMPYPTPDNGSYFVGWSYIPDSNDNIIEDITIVARFEKKETLVITAKDMEKSYDGTPLVAEPDGYTVTGLKPGHTIKTVLSGQATEVGVPAPAQFMEIDIIGAGHESVIEQYSIILVPGTLEILPAEVTITVKDASKTYGEDDPNFTGTVTGVVDGEDLGVEFIRNPLHDGVENVGAEIELTATHTADKNYNVTIVPGKLEILANGTMAVKAEGVRVTYDGKYYGVTAQSNIDDAVIRYMDENGAYTLTESPVYKDAGEYKVSFQATRTGYTTVTGSATIVIEKAEATINVKDASKIYGEDDPGFAGAVTGVVDGEDLGVEFIRNPLHDDRENVGANIELTAIYTKDTNYSVTVVPGKLEITRRDAVIEMGNSTITSGEELPHLAFTVSGLLEGDNLNVVGYTSYTAGAKPGEYPIYASYTDDTNYNITLIPGTLTVQPRGDMEVWAKQVEVTYNGEYHGLLAQSNVDGAVIRYMDEDGEYTLTESPAFKDAGEYAVHFEATHPNYTTVTNVAKVIVEKAEAVIRVNRASKTYGAADPAFSGKVSGVLAGDIVGLNVQYARASGYRNVESAGAYVALSASYTENNNYSVTVEPGVLEINQRDAVVRMDSYTIKTDEALPDFTYTTSGVLSGDSLNIEGYTSYTTGGAAGEYPILARYSNSNYKVTVVQGTLTVEEAEQVTTTTSSETSSEPDVTPSEVTSTSSTTTTSTGSSSSSSSSGSSSSSSSSNASSQASSEPEEQTPVAPSENGGGDGDGGYTLNEDGSVTYVTPDGAEVTLEEGSYSILRNGTVLDHDPESEYYVEDNGLVEMLNNEVPLAGFLTRGGWSLVSLLLALLALLNGAMSFARMLLQRKQERENGTINKSRRLRMLLASLTGLPAILLFLGLENLNLTMVIFNRYTPFIALVFAVHLACFVISCLKRRQKAEEEEGSEIENA